MDDMECPRCGGETLAEAKLDDVVVDHCPKCSGMWLDFAQLERVLSRESRALRELLPDTAPEPRAHDETLSCPRCRSTLIRMRAAPDPLTYYSCLTCYGRWVDGNEIYRIVGRPLARKFEALFQKLLG
jgi:Zn-finger nucleic acid-binding protein